jgi:Mn2+/Fe2+ NRAMP family transporter
MRKRIIISTSVAFLVGFFWFAPGDFFSQLCAGFVAAFLCGVPLLALGRLHFMKSASNSVRTFIIILVCAVILLSLKCYLLTLEVNREQRTIAGHVEPENVPRVVEK